MLVCLSPLLMNVLIIHVLIQEQEVALIQHLSACQTNCTAPVTFECDWPGNCYDPGDGSGWYTTYADCMNDCTPQPTWDCVAPGNCQDPGDESGNYWSLQDCQNACPVTPTWDCDAT